LVNIRRSWRRQAKAFGKPWNRTRNGQADWGTGSFVCSLRAVFCTLRGTSGGCTYGRLANRPLQPTSGGKIEIGKIEIE
jgi:hypothetical protein